MTTATAKHTPTPWKWINHPRLKHCLVGADGTIQVTATAAFQNPEDRKLIIRSVNCHSQLLEMLRDYVEWHEAAIPKNERDDYETEYLLAGARAAIAAAEAK